MKKILLTIGLLLSSSIAFASTSGVFPIQLTLPAATTVKFVVSQVTPGSPPTFVEHGGNFLNFDTAGLDFSSANGTYLPKKFWAIDVAPTDAAGVPAPGNYGSISFTYSSNVVPSGQPATEGLNNRATFTAVKVQGATDSQTETTLQKAALGASHTDLTQADVDGGFLRVYVGGATGETEGPNFVTGTKPFTLGDKPGTYTGTLTITATLL